ncbi:hypothetical protein NMG60_11017944 [Bertholletia excelsa]
MEGEEPLPHPKKKKCKNSRRFSDEQIKSLETMFKSETRLEPRKKLQLARELGLQPRQIAIWFQNRRARWKSKQIEHDYKVLKADYDSLQSRFESLKEEREYLLVQLQKLSELVGKPCHPGSTSNDLKGNSTPGGGDSEDTCHDFNTTRSCLNKGSDHTVIAYSDDEEGGSGGYFYREEQGLLNMGGPVNEHVVRPEKWSNFDSTGRFDQSCENSNWWDFWN